MPWQFTLAVVAAFVLGWLARSALVLLDDSRDSRAVAALIAEAVPMPSTEESMQRSETPHEPRLLRTRFCPEGYSAKQVLGYHDGGARYHAPLYPRGAHETSLDAWDARQGRPAAA